MDAEVLDCLLVKLRRFVEEELSPDEREALARLLAPGVALVFEGAEAEVEGFAALQWPSRLDVALADALRRAGLRVEGLG